jgi:hypothetical protein
MGGMMLFGPMLGLGQAGELPALDQFTDLGPDTIKIKAGRIKAQRYKLERTEGRYDVWVSEAVPLWGLALIVFPGGRFELVKHGRGAASEITEKPMRLDLPFLSPPGGAP